MYLIKKIGWLFIVLPLVGPAQQSAHSRDKDEYSFIQADLKEFQKSGKRKIYLREYLRRIGRLEKFAKRNKDSRFAADALLNAGRLHQQIATIALGSSQADLSVAHFQKALTHYLAVAQNYPQRKEAAHALLYASEIQADHLGNVGEAKRHIMRILQITPPLSKLYKKAKAIIDKRYPVKIAKSSVQKKAP